MAIHSSQPASGGQPILPRTPALFNACTHACAPAVLQDSKAEQDKSAATQAELAGRVDPLPADAISAALQRQVAGGAVAAAAPAEVRSAPACLPGCPPQSGIASLVALQLLARLRGCKTNQTNSFRLVCCCSAGGPQARCCRAGARCRCRRPGGAQEGKGRCCRCRGARGARAEAAAAAGGHRGCSRARRCRCAGGCRGTRRQGRGTRRRGRQGGQVCAVGRL